MLSQIFSTNPSHNLHPMYAVSPELSCLRAQPDSITRITESDISSLFLPGFKISILLAITSANIFLVGRVSSGDTSIPLICSNLPGFFSIIFLHSLSIKKTAGGGLSNDFDNYLCKYTEQTVTISVGKPIVALHNLLHVTDHISFSQNVKPFLLTRIYQRDLGCLQFDPLYHPRDLLFCI